MSQGQERERWDSQGRGPGCQKALRRPAGKDFAEEAGAEPVLSSGNALLPNPPRSPLSQIPPTSPSRLGSWPWTLKLQEAPHCCEEFAPAQSWGWKAFRDIWANFVSWFPRRAGKRPSRGLGFSSSHTAEEKWTLWLKIFLGSCFFIASAFLLWLLLPPLPENGKFKVSSWCSYSTDQLCDLSLSFLSYRMRKDLPPVTVNIQWEWCTLSITQYRVNVDCLLVAFKTLFLTSHTLSLNIMIYTIHICIYIFYISLSKSQVL